MFEYFKEYLDFRVLLITLALVAIGLFSVYSATFDARAGEIFERQLLWSGVGLLALLGAAFVPLRTIQRFSLPLYAATLVVLLVVLVLGRTIAGSRSWFGVGGLGIQPSEFAKVVTVLAVASFLGRTTTTLSSRKDLALTVGIVLLPTILILAQPDLGTALVFLAITLPLLYWAGVDIFFLAVVVSPVIVAVGALFGTTLFVVGVAVSLVLLLATRKNLFAAAVAFGGTIIVGLSVQVIFDRMPAYQQKRILAFINPEADPLGAGYNVLQSKVAIGSGGFFGKGFLKGTQTQLNFIPEQWTDFIFCVPGEEFGFLGASLVLVLFGLLLWRGIHIASVSKNSFSSIAAIGIVSILSFHVFVNIGMSMGLLPVVGIPLPYLSYGGSALVANMIMAGLLMNFYANRKEH